jgi:hypothetical protein
MYFVFCLSSFILIEYDVGDAPFQASHGTQLLAICLNQSTMRVTVSIMSTVSLLMTSDRQQRG